MHRLDVSAASSPALPLHPLDLSLEFEAFLALVMDRLEYKGSACETLLLAMQAEPLRIMSLSTPQSSASNLTEAGVC